MNRRSQDGVFKRFFGSRLFLIIAIIILALVALSYARAYYQDFKIRQQITALQAEVKQLEKKKLESMEILEYVTSDAFVEEKARTELNMKKPGERVIVIDDSSLLEIPPVDISQDLATNAVANTQLSNPMKWWYYFTHQSIN